MITALRSGAELAAVADRAAVELADASARGDPALGGRRVRQRSRGARRRCRTPCWCTWRRKRCPGIDVLFLDTGYHFIETIGTADAVEAVYDVTLRRLLPLQTVAEQDAQYGKDLFARDPDLCCALRKVAPLNRALSGYEAWATGVRRAESPTRANTPVVAVRRQARQGQDRAAGRLVRRRCRRLHRREQRPGQPAAERRLPLDRLRALHPAGVAGPGFPGRPLGRPGQDRMWDQYMTSTQTASTQVAAAAGPSRPAPPCG